MSSGGPVATKNPLSVGIGFWDRAWCSRQAASGELE